MKKQKHISWLLIFFFTGSIFSGMFISIPDNNIVVADTQTWENEYGKLEVEPATSTNFIRQRQWYNLTWYYPDNTVDIAFGFNDSLSYGNVFYWDGDSYNRISVNHVEYNGDHFYVLNNINVNQDETKHGYWEYDVPPGSNGKWDMYAKLSSDSWSTAFTSGRIIHLDPWWNFSWSKRKDLFIDHNQINDTLKNFPVLVHIENDVDMVGEVQVDLDDIVFVSTDNLTIYNHEIENYTVASSVYANIWVNVSSISHTVDTHFNMYYGNTICSNQEDPVNVWDINYVAVYHMNVSTTNISGCFDSTYNANHATYVGDLPTNTNDAQVGYGQTFDGTDDYITFPAGCWLVNNSGVFGTHESWTEADATNAWYSMMMQRDDGTGGLDQAYWRYGLSGGFRYAGDSDGDFNQWYVDDSGTSSTNWEYHAHAMAQDDVAFWDDGNVIFVDGSCWMPNAPVADKLFHGFGSSFDGGYDFSGDADEIRISNIRRNSSWLEASYNTMYNQSGVNSFITFGSELGDIDNVQPVTSLTSNTTSVTTIILNWTQSTNGTYSYIERNTTTSWTRGEGTFLYNATGTTTTDSNLSRSNLYYYQVWAFNDSVHNFSSYETTNNDTGPENPSGIVVSIVDNDLNLTWIKGLRADNTVIVRKENSNPTGIDDGTQIYNGSATGYTDTSKTSTSYYVMYSFDTTKGLQSSGVIVSWGALQVQVFDENTSAQIFNFTVFVTNASGTETYEVYSANTQSITIDINDLPTGEDVVIKINASVFTGNWSAGCGDCDNTTNTTIEYQDRIYIMDIFPNNYYNVTTYLSRIIDAESYVVRVIDEMNNPVSGASVSFRRYINATVGYQNVSIRSTDGNGYITISLIPGEIYKLIIVADGFITATPDMFPISIVYVEDRYHTFRIDHSEIDYEEPHVYSEEITFNGFLDHIANELCVNFTDATGNTTDTAIYIYEYNYTTFNATLIHTDIRTGDNDFQICTSVNSSNMHYAILFHNHSDFNYVKQTLYFEGYNTSDADVDYPITTQEVRDNLFDLNYGTNPFGWTNFFTWILLLICYFQYGRAETGMAAIISGVVLLFINYMIGFNTVMITLAGGGIPILHIVMGAMMIWRDAKKGVNV